MLVIIAWLPRLNFFVLLPLVLRIKETSSITTLINNKLSARIYFPHFDTHEYVYFCPAFFHWTAV